MITRIGLEGQWKLRLDREKRGTEASPFDDTMMLPGTTSHAGKGHANEEALADSLTDVFKFEGYAWFSREVNITAEQAGWNALLYLERTRVTTVWIDGKEIGTQNSLCTPHVYELGKELTEGTHRITIRVDNTSYPTKGGHMTSADTQTNWNGITGRLELQFVGASYLEEVQVYPDAVARTFTIKAKVVGMPQGKLFVSAASRTEEGAKGYTLVSEEAADSSLGGKSFAVTSGELEVVYTLGADALLWSDTVPNLYELKLHLVNDTGALLDEQTIVAGLRNFKAEGDKFTINGTKTFLRGKHDGLIFPLTGYAPTTLDEWIRILGISKAYGINHYRFHTCCPPEAAFEAADILGIYMEPELPFWGTVTKDGDDKHNEEEQNYLIQEGFAILRAFGNHPSFVMMSLGNELWGSKERIAEIMRGYKDYDSRPLYTQGSNNFQFVPIILDEDDFYCGVRFSKERLFRGSYAMCDAPLGHIQTDKPGTMKDYDEEIVPSGRAGDSGTDGGELQIQYGTEAITVKAEAAAELIPSIPVISHEIGQFGMYPNYTEIEKYTGPLKARNFELFRERLEAKGMGHLAEKFFRSSGKLAVECYKEELEAAFRTRQLAGFQLLDLQDFSGQGTALVGILDAFMDSKGLVVPEEWRTYCSDAVLLARFESYVWMSGDMFRASAELAWFRPEPLGAVETQWELRLGSEVLAGGSLRAIATAESPYVDLGSFEVGLPSLDTAQQLQLRLWIEGIDVHKSYALWVFPRVEAGSELDGLHMFDELTDEVASLLEKGENVVLFAKSDALTSSIKGTYCTDFWNYPMFRSISESMNKPVPVGTMGLLIDKEHPALQGFPSDTYSTYPWWSIVSRSSSLVLDELPKELSPIVQTIDNVERNHKLGLLFECRTLNGNLLVCGAEVEALAESPEGRQLLRSIADYAKSDAFNPETAVELTALKGLFRT